ncbi:hypothetical protein [Polynucleobacter sp. AP-Reno-20A-A9]|nr:hypothetical protein [Polynucleobacter sp. AP-Reno-20A-A9]MBU3629413.1 hypothetical protein [Polynucleobacter sp. AP-Reno-20A-A9]
MNYVFKIVVALIAAGVFASSTFSQEIPARAGTIAAEKSGGSAHSKLVLV